MLQSQDPPAYSMASLFIGINGNCMVNTDVSSGVSSRKLKLVSMHFCRGELRRATSVLNEVEFDLDDLMQPVCGSRIIPYTDKPSKGFCEYTVVNNSHDQLT